MITQSGAVCDVCGHHILPVDPDERVNFFRVAQLVGSDLCCHNKCKEDVLAAGKDWQKLPTGPLRKVYEDADKTQVEQSNGTAGAGVKTEPQAGAPPQSHVDAPAN